MSDYFAMSELELNALANAINAKTGKSGTILGKDMASEVSSIVSLASIVTGDAITIDFDVPAYAFYNNTHITSITFGEHCTSIGQYAFYGCTALEEIDLSNSGVTSIGPNCFAGCTALTEITISENVTSISYGAFNNCTSMTTVYFNAISCNDFAQPSSTSGEIFGRANPITTFTFGENVTRIPANLFCYYGNTNGIIRNISSITVPNATIANYAFYKGIGIKKLILSEGITSIPANFASDCGSLQEVVLPSTLTSIGDSAFSNCTSLQELNLPTSNSLTLGKYVFQNCSSLTSFTIPYNVVSIKGYCFQNCSHITTLNVEKHPLGTALILAETSNGYFHIFQGCTNLINLNLNRQISWTYNTSSVFTWTSLKTVNIGEDVSTLGDYFFVGCANLDTIRIFRASNVVNISSSAINGCTKINTAGSSSIYVPSSLVAGYQGDLSTGFQNNIKAYDNDSVMTIGSTDYTTTGETWNDWLISANNTDGYLVSGNNVLNSTKTHYVAFNGVAVKPTDSTGLFDYTLEAI